MTAEQFEQSLRDLLRREPFQPFTVEYTHGDRFAIDSPDHVEKVMIPRDYNRDQHRDCAGAAEAAGAAG